MTTIAYIDGLNLYYGSLKNRPALRWLDVAAMLKTLLPQLNISGIKYFSSLVMENQDSPGAAQRQSVYFRALNTIPALTIHEGRMASRTKRGVVIPETIPPQVVTIRVFEETRTDVNIAAHLLLDAFADRYDTAVIVSNDSDLTTPVAMATAELGKRAIVVNPYPARRQSRELRAAATHTLRMINLTVLRDCQFPDTLADARGSFRRPNSWV